MKTKEEFNKLDDYGKWNTCLFMHNHFKKIQQKLFKERVKNKNMKRTFERIIKQAKHAIEHEYAKG